MKLLAVIFYCCFFLSLAADENTEIVKKGQLLYNTELSGIVLGKSVHEIKLAAKEFPQWQLKHANKHGDLVKKGETIAHFEEEALNEEIARQESQLALQKLNFAKQQELYKMNLNRMEVELKKAKLQQTIENQKNETYLKIGRVLEKENIEQILADAKNGLSYQKEELAQLKKMYGEDEVTDETEELVLRRQLDQVNRYEKMLKTRQYEVNEGLNSVLPLNISNAEYAQFIGDFNHKKVQADWEVAILAENKKLEEFELNLKKMEKKLKSLIEDKEFLVITAPADGVVYFGDLQGGKWQLQADSYEAEQVFQKGVTLFHLVENNQFKIQAKINLEQNLQLNKDTSFFVEIPGKGFQKISLQEQAKIPVNGAYSLTFDLGESEIALHGIEVKIKALRKLSEETISLPISAIKTEELDPAKKFVEVSKDGKVEKRYVQTGLIVQGRVVILGGIEEGMAVKVK